MKKYVVVGLQASFNTGQRLQLSPEQAKPRKETGAIRFIKGDLYEVVTRVEFKRGEEVGFDGDISKTQLQEIVPVGHEAAQKAKKETDSKKQKKKETPAKTVKDEKKAEEEDPAGDENGAEDSDEDDLDDDGDKAEDESDNADGPLILK